MIRLFQTADIDRIADIWLDTNIRAHHFIPAQYWQNNFDIVKEMFSRTEIYVYEEQNRIKGFIGMDDTYIAGIFVTGEAQSGGIGHLLIDYIKTIKPQLSLSVYQKNTRAVKFYQRENFEIQRENIDAHTSEKEYTMIWSGNRITP